MKAQTMIGKLFLVFCCISMALSFAFISNASADENGRIEGNAEINCSRHSDTNKVEVDLEGTFFSLYATADCSTVENANQIKVSCKGQGSPMLFIIPVAADSAIPVNLEKCKIERCDYGTDECGVEYGHGQATLAANYKEAYEINIGPFHYEVDNANFSLTCFFDKDKD